MGYFDDIYNLQCQLYPTGRAFYAPLFGGLSKLKKALALSFKRLYLDTLFILYDILPDNQFFDVDDANNWERRLGMYDGSANTLAVRKQAILQRMAFPGEYGATENYKYVEGQLRDAGFDVYITENRFPVSPGVYQTRNPLDFTGGIGSIGWQLNDHQLGDAQLGGEYGNFVANYVEEARDMNFQVGSNLRSTFFIGGPDITNPAQVYAQVPLTRKNEFRQLILSLKPLQTVAFLFVVYV